MKDVRIGNDISVIWSLYSDQKPFLLDGLKISVYLKGMYGKTKIEDYTIKDNEIHWTFFGKDQKHTGKYSLTLVVNEGAEGMVTTDVCDLVRLVSCTCQADGSDEEGVQTETIAVNSEVELLSGGFGRIDTALDPMSENAVSNAVITAEFGKVNEATSGLKTQMADDKAELMTNLEQVGVLAYEAAMRSSRNEQDKVSKEEGKGLSTNDYTDEDKSKLEGLDNYDDSEVKQSIKEVRESIANINPSPMVSVTYSELVELRNNGELIAGMQYRITDYVTTTAQENTRSAGHPFDVIVTADSNNALNEVARACLHEGDDYFLNEAPKLEAWKIWYCLDNDAERFAWADAENGRGVIYRMIDDWNNDLPYDFKNIMFKRYELNAPELYEASDTSDYWAQKLSENIRAMFDSNCYAFIWSGIYKQDKYWENDFEEVMSTPTGRARFFYTFSDDSNIPNDFSLGNACYNNVMLSHYMLPNNVFFVGTKQYDISNNRFGSNCGDNSISSNSSDNTFGSECYGNCFGPAFNYNTFGNNCSYNSFGGDCKNNDLGDRSNYNSLGNGCCNNSFSNGSAYNGLGMKSIYNIFGNGCAYNALGNNCMQNSFGNGCNSNSFRDLEGFASFSYCKFDTGVRSFEIYCDDYNGEYTAKYIHVYSGVTGWVEFGGDNRKYETCYACNKNGKVIEFCILDFANS